MLVDLLTLALLKAQNIVEQVRVRACWYLVLTQAVLVRLVGQMAGYNISYQTARANQEIGAPSTQLLIDLPLPILRNYKAKN